MGRTQKSPSTSHLNFSSKQAEVSDSESESSSEDEIKTPALNYDAKIKSEPECSSEDSENDSDDNEVLTQKFPPRNFKEPSSSSENDSEPKGNKYDIKQEAETLEEHFDGNSNRDIFQTKKYVYNNSKNETPAMRDINQVTQKPQESEDSSSSSSEQDTLRTAFLGKKKRQSKKKIHGITNEQASVQINELIIDKKNDDSPKTDNTKVQVLQHIKFTPMKPKDLLQEMYPQLTPINIKQYFNINSSDELYLLRIPKIINPQQLLNKELDLTQGSKLKVDHERYELELANKVPDPFLLVSSQSRTIQPKNSFFLKKYIKSMKIPDLEIIQKAMVPLPDNLKSRHPLFGSNYEDKIQLSEEVELRLQKAIKHCLKQDEKIRKKKKFKSTDDNQSEVIFSLLGNHISHKSNHSEEQYDSAFGSSETHNNIAKKKKSKRKSIDDFSVGINSQLPVAEKIKQSPIMELIEDSPKKKKKSKTKRSNDEFSLNGLKTSILNSVDDVDNPKALIEELSIIAPEHDQILKKTHKKKEKKRQSSVIGEQSMFESTRIDVKLENPERYSVDSMKQSIVEEILTKMKKELLTECESGDDDKIMKKNKKKRKSRETNEKAKETFLKNIKQEVLSDFCASASKKRKRTKSLVEEDNNISEVTLKKSKKSKKHSGLSENRLSLESEYDSVLENVKIDKKTKSF